MVCQFLAKHTTKYLNIRLIIIKHKSYFQWFWVIQLLTVNGPIKKASIGTNKNCQVWSVYIFIN